MKLKFILRYRRIQLLLKCVLRDPMVIEEGVKVDLGLHIEVVILMLEGTLLNNSPHMINNQEEEVMVDLSTEAEEVKPLSPEVILKNEFDVYSQPIIQGFQSQNTIENPHILLNTQKI